VGDYHGIADVSLIFNTLKDPTERSCAPLEPFILRFSEHQQTPKEIILMPLETGTYLSDLVPANPAHTDGMNQGDAHMRLIKSVIKNTFPNFTSAALNSTQAAIDNAVAVVTGVAAHLIPVGTLAALSLHPVGDGTTGIFSPGTGKLAVVSGGAATLTCNTDGSANFGGSLAVAATMAAGAYAGGTGQLIPTGTPLMWLTDTAPTGFLMANGQAVSRITYAALFAVYSTAFGAGDGSTTFNLPDMRDVVPVGKSTMGGTTARGLITHLTNTTLGAAIGEEQHLLSQSEMPAHNHTATSTVTDNGHAHTLPITWSGNGGGVGGFIHGGQTPGSADPQGGVVPVTSTQTTNITVATTTANTGGGTAHNNVQPSITVNYIIKT
jgi:microcystin-dependent protein